MMCEIGQNCQKKNKSQLRMFAGEKDGSTPSQRDHPGKGRNVCHGPVGGVLPLIFGKLYWKRWSEFQSAILYFQLKR
jgi:hypothetical protein